MAMKSGTWRAGESQDGFFLMCVLEDCMAPYISFCASANLSLLKEKQRQKEIRFLVGTGETYPVSFAPGLD